MVESKNQERYAKLAVIECALGPQRKLERKEIKKTRKRKGLMRESEEVS